MLKNEDEPITISFIQSWYVKSKNELIIKEGKFDAKGAKI